MQWGLQGETGRSGLWAEAVQSQIDPNKGYSKPKETRNNPAKKGPERGWAIDRSRSPGTNAASSAIRLNSRRRSGKLAGESSWRGGRDAGLLTGQELW